MSDDAIQAEIDDLLYWAKTKYSTFHGTEQKGLEITYELRSSEVIIGRAYWEAPGALVDIAIGEPLARADAERQLWEIRRKQLEMEANQ
jgi:hypothetical protein